MGNEAGEKAVLVAREKAAERDRDRQQECERIEFISVQYTSNSFLSPCGVNTFTESQ